MSRLESDCEKADCGWFMVYHVDKRFQAFFVVCCVLCVLFCVL